MDLGGYFFWLGASAEEADPALVASDQAAARLAPRGVDPLRDLELATEFIGNEGASLYVEDCDRIVCTLKSVRRGLKHMGVA